MSNTSEYNKSIAEEVLQQVYAEATDVTTLTDSEIKDADHILIVKDSGIGSTSPESLRTYVNNGMAPTSAVNELGSTVETLFQAVADAYAELKADPYDKPLKYVTAPEARRFVADAFRYLRVNADIENWEVTVQRVPQKDAGSSGRYFLFRRYSRADSTVFENIQVNVSQGKFLTDDLFYLKTNDIEFLLDYSIFGGTTFANSAKTNVFATPLAYDPEMAERKQFARQTGRFWSSSGGYGTDANYTDTGLIAIDRKSAIKVYGSGGIAIAAITLFDASGRFLSNKLYPGGGAYFEVEIPAEEIPAEAYYFAGCTKNLGGIPWWSNGATREERENATVSAIQSGKLAVLIDRWNAVFGSEGKYNAQTGYFEAFDTVKDITAEQALTVLEKGVFRPPFYHSIGKMSHVESPRVTVATKHFSGSVINLSYKLFNLYLEVAMLAKENDQAVASDVTYFCQDCVKLRKIIGIINVSGCSSLGKMFTGGLPLLESVKIMGLKTALDLSALPKLDMESLQYLIDNSKVTTSATVTLHADVYAKLTDEMIASATAKKITLAKS